MVKRSSTALQGMKEIGAYVNRSEATVLDWIRNLDFPANKMDGGIWESDKTAIDDWRRKMITGPKIRKKEEKSSTKKKIKKEKIR